MSEQSMDDVLTAETDEFRCWCGVVGEYEEMCSDDDLDGDCGGLGTLNCYCGGDLCVCHNHGEVECYGCEDCVGLEAEFLEPVRE